MIYTATVLPARVAALMKEHGTTQAELAAALGLPQQRISESLNNRRRFTVADLCNISMFYGVSPGELLAGTDVLFTKGL